MAKIVRTGDGLYHTSVWNITNRIVIRETVEQLGTKTRCNLGNLKGVCQPRAIEVAVT